MKIFKDIHGIEINDHWLSDGEGPCWECGKPTPVVNLSYQTWMCSFECLAEKEIEIGEDLKQLGLADDSI